MQFPFIFEVTKFFYYSRQSINHIITSTFSISMLWQWSTVHVPTIVYTIPDCYGFKWQVLVNISLTICYTLMITDLLDWEERYFRIVCLGLMFILYLSSYLGRKDQNLGMLTSWIHLIVITILFHFCIDTVAIVLMLHSCHCINAT